MNNGRVIVLSDGDSVEVWGSLTEICRVKGLSHNYLKKKHYPFEYKGMRFERVGFREDNGVMVGVGGVGARELGKNIGKFMAVDVGTSKVRDVLAEVFAITNGEWDDPVIVPELYKKMEDALK